MVKMWGVWMIFFQVLLESSFAMFVEGPARNLFGLVEGVFEVALFFEVGFDMFKSKEKPGNYNMAIFITYAITWLLFFGVLLFAPDPVDPKDADTARASMYYACSLSVAFLLIQVIGLMRGVDYRDKDDAEPLN